MNLKSRFANDVKDHTSGRTNRQSERLTPRPHFEMLVALFCITLLINPSAAQPAAPDRRLPTDIADVLMVDSFEGNRTVTLDNALNEVGFHNAIAIGADGLPVVSYRDKTAGALKVAKCNNATCSDGNVTVTTVEDPTNGSVFFTSIAIGSDGLPVISYHDATAGSLRVAKCNDSACAGQNETASTIDNPAATVGSYSSIAVGSDGLPVISYYDATAGILKVAKCNDAACSGEDETVSRVDDPVNVVGTHTAIAIGADDLPVVSYYDFSAGNLKVAKCNDSACSGNDETITSVDASINDVGIGTSVTIGLDGYPVIAYLDATAATLKIAKCNDIACATESATISTIDDASVDSSLHVSIAIGADGFPVVSYQDFSSSRIHVAKCYNAACTEGDVVVNMIDESPNQIGRYTAITIGQDRVPIISYHDSTAGTLRLARCGNLECR